MTTPGTTTAILKLALLAHLMSLSSGYDGHGCFPSVFADAHARDYGFGPGYGVYLSSDLFVCGLSSD